MCYSHFLYFLMFEYTVDLFTVYLSNRHVAKINNKLWPFQISSSDASRDLKTYLQKCGLKLLIL